MVNHRPVEGYSSGFVSSGPAADLAAFDRLPPTARRALDEAPFAISAVAAFECWKEHGYHALMREIKASVDEWLAACEKETGIPRPVVRVKKCRRS